MQKSKRLFGDTFHIFLGIDSRSYSSIVSLSKTIDKEFGSEFVVDDEYYEPHITLYLFSAPSKNLKKILLESERISREIGPITLKAGPLFLSWDGWLMVDILDKTGLNNIHRRTVVAINKLRNGYLREKYKDPASLVDLPAKEKRNLMRFGDKHSMDLFNPHISVAQIVNKEKLTKAYEKYQHAFVGKKIKVSSFNFIKANEGKSGGKGEKLIEYHY